MLESARIIRSVPGIDVVINPLQPGPDSLRIDITSTEECQGVENFKYACAFTTSAVHYKEPGCQLIAIAPGSKLIKVIISYDYYDEDSPSHDSVWLKGHFWFWNCNAPLPQQGATIYLSKVEVPDVIVSTVRAPEGVIKH